MTVTALQVQPAVYLTAVADLEHRRKVQP